MNPQQELIPMATGEHLKQQRLRKKLSLKDVAGALNLDDKVLEDLEEDRALRIADVYRNGYIRSYARYLGIPDDEIGAMLESGDLSQPELKNIFAVAPRRSPADRWLRATSYVLASLLIGTLAWQFTHEAVRLSQGGSSLQAAGSNTRDQSQPVRGPVNASIATLGALHDKRAGGQDPAEQAWAALAQPPPADGESQLELRFSADSWVEISDSDGRELEMDLLRGGSQKTYRGKPPFRILIGRASAVHVSMDGEEIDLAAHTREDVAQFHWPQTLEAADKGPSDN
jgi:cytoskeleton protein RodZ